MAFYSDHTFAIPAYGESPFLEDCIKSLKAQTLKSNIIIATSTPSEFIENLSKKYDIPLFINEKSGGIGNDWNFAVSKTKTNLVTVAHQDDTYLEDYLENIVSAFKKSKNPILLFTNYSEIVDGSPIENRRNLKIKRLISLRFNNKLFGNKKWFKRSLLSIGCPIGCPTVTLQTEIVGKTPYISDYLFVLDWLTWEKLSKLKGNFVFVDKILMLHRRHEDAATSKYLKNDVREKEDLEVLGKFWWKPVAKLIQKFFAKA